jgi:hypothetical protein
MYTNIPTSHLPTIINSICQFQNTPITIKKEILKITKTLIKQNYFIFQQNIYKQTEGLAMGAPTSAIFSEIYLQHIEHTALVNILTKHKIHGYYRYVDDILLIYDVNSTDINLVLQQFNSVSKHLNFKLENENNKQLNFLDVTIKRQPKHFDFNIYRKPTLTNHMIPNDSCHPQEHKNSAIQFLTNRLNTYPLSATNKEKETSTIQQILSANKYKHTMLQNLQKPTRDKNYLSKTQTNDTKRAVFTYTGKSTRAVTKILHKAGIKVTYTAKHTINNLLRQKQDYKDKFDNSGIYLLECKDCKKQYVGQTGRSFKTRFKEHKRDYETTSNKSLFAKHLIDSNHQLDSLENSLTILKFQQKGRMMNTIEQYHIYRITKTGNQLNEQFTEKQNPIFEAVLRLYPDK